jgi:hypothetical protein
MAAILRQMNREQFNALPLTEKELFVKKKGQLIEAEDDYSYRLLFYTLDDHLIELMYDNETDTIVSATLVEEDNIRNINVDLDAGDDL